MRLLVGLLLAVWFFYPVQGAESRISVTIKEWTGSWPNSRLRDSFDETKGNIWFMAQKTQYIAQLDSRKGKFRRHKLKDQARPQKLVVGRDDIVCYTGNSQGLHRSFCRRRL